MSVQVVGTQDRCLHVGVFLLDQDKQLFGEIMRRPAVRHPHLAVAAQGPEGQEDWIRRYAPEFLVRFSISYLLVYLLAFIYELQKSRAAKRLKLLSGLLPICANCKKIRDERGDWNQVETYIQQHSDTEFSHSICPECARELYPELNLKK